MLVFEAVYHEGLKKYMIGIYQERSGWYTIDYVSEIEMLKDYNKIKELLEVRSV